MKQETLAIIILIISSIVAALTVTFGVGYLLIHAGAYLLGLS